MRFERVPGIVHCARKVRRLLCTVMALLAGSAVVWAGGAALPGSLEPVGGTVRFVERSEKRCVVEYTRSEKDCAAQSIGVGSDRFGTMAEPGKPALPARTMLFLVPAGHRTSVTVLSEASRWYEGVYNGPVEAKRHDGEFSSGHVGRTSDATVGLYPGKPVAVTGMLCFRGNTIARVRLCPVQVDRVHGKTKVYRRIRFAVSFVPDGKLSKRRKALITRRGCTLLSNVVCNRDQVPPPTHLSGTSLSKSRATGSAGSAGRLLILTVDRYKEAADTLADWRRRMGFAVTTVSRSSWTDTEVKSAIHGEYASTNGDLDFVAILGDDPDVPAERFGSPRDISDLYYACMDGPEDFVPDIATGRISVSSPTEAMAVVQKLVAYERTPPEEEHFYTHAMTTGYFDHLDDGYARYDLARTAWRVRGYLIGHQGYSVDRVLFTEPSVTPLYWNDGNLSGGEPVPDSLRRPAWNWEADAATIGANINAGRFLVVSHEHGNESKWVNSAFTTDHVGKLTNGNLLPLVLAMNCHTGLFWLGSSPGCLAETFLRHPTGGAVGMVGATRGSMAGYNGSFSEGMIDAIWPEPGLITAFPHNPSPTVNEHEPIYHTGYIMLQGKLRMSQTWCSGDSGGFSAREKRIYEIFHYFGDPATRLWTAVPEAITATHAPTIEPGAETFDITDAACEEGIATLYHGGAVIGACRIAQGKGDMPLDPPPHSGTAELTVTAHNYRPYTKTIAVEQATAVRAGISATTAPRLSIRSDGIVLHPGRATGSTVHVRIYNPAGRLVRQESIEHVQGRRIIRLPARADGTCLVSVSVGGVRLGTPFIVAAITP